MLLFLPGFATPPRAYDALLAPVQDLGLEVTVPRLYGLNGYLGRYTAADEARAAMALIAGAPRVWLAGHSRGGQVAWRMASMVDPAALAGVMVIDPVDGSGPRSAATATASPAMFTCPTLIVGGGLSGRCAPVPLNHEQFARAMPAAEHVVLADMGHADMLCGGPLRWGRRLCGGGADPAAERATVTALLVEFIQRG
jgi:pimeloyl-ACP methyl ester carboxylesterase